MLVTAAKLNVRAAIHTGAQTGPAAVHLAEDLTCICEVRVQYLPKAAW
jgi:hypothetical protein